MASGKTENKAVNVVWSQLHIKDKDPKETYRRANGSGTRIMGHLKTISLYFKFPTINSCYL